MNFEGIEIATDTKSWKEIRGKFPKLSATELQVRIANKLETVFKAEGISLDRDLYMESLGKIARDMGWHTGAFCLKIFGRWTASLESIFSELVIIGGGACEECGADAFEDWDYGDHGEVIHICGHCKHRQELEE